MSSSACLDMSSHGLQHLFRDVRVVVDSLTGIHSVTVKYLFVVNRSRIHGFICVLSGKNPEDSNLASVEAMQWILLYGSICHDRCY
jgi:hypothetical protein